jgi:hypothetical protein
MKGEPGGRVRVGRREGIIMSTDSHDCVRSIFDLDTEEVFKVPCDQPAPKRPSRVFTGKTMVKSNRFNAQAQMWSDLEIVVHGIEESGYTMCGLRVGDERSGWWFDRHEGRVTCKRCLQSIEKSLR